MRKQWRWNHRSNEPNESGTYSGHLGRLAVRDSPRRAAILRNEPGAVQALRLASNRDRAFPRPLLSRGARGSDGRGPTGRTVLRAALEDPRPTVPREDADHTLRLTHRVPAD